MHWSRTICPMGPSAMQAKQYMEWKGQCQQRFICLIRAECPVMARYGTCRIPQVSLALLHPRVIYNLCHQLLLWTEASCSKCDRQSKNKKRIEPFSQVAGCFICLWLWIKCCNYESLDSEQQIYRLQDVESQLTSDWQSSKEVYHTLEIAMVNTHRYYYHILIFVTKR